MPITILHLRKTIHCSVFLWLRTTQMCTTREICPHSSTFGVPTCARIALSRAKLSVLVCVPTTLEKKNTNASALRWYNAGTFQHAILPPLAGTFGFFLLHLLQIWHVPHSYPLMYPHEVSNFTHQIMWVAEITHMYPHQRHQKGQCHLPTGLQVRSFRVCTSPMGRDGRGLAQIMVGASL